MPFVADHRPHTRHEHRHADHVGLIDSQKISTFLKETLTSYLSPLVPLMAPNRILGEYLEGFTLASIANVARGEAPWPS